MKIRSPLLLCLILIAALTAASLALASHPTSTSSPAVTLDNFDSETLDTAWSWIREDATRWSLTSNPGFLRITIQPGELLEDTYLIQNILSRRAPVGEFTIETSLIFAPDSDIQRAGLIIYMDDQNLLMLLEAYCNFQNCAGPGLYFDLLESNVSPEENYAINLPLDTLYLRIIRAGDQYTAQYSEDNINWTLLGTHTTTAGFHPVKIGLVADWINFGGEEIDADFDYFSLTSNELHVFLPVIAK